MAKRNPLDPNLLLDAAETIPGHLASYQIESVVSHTGPVAVYAAHDLARPWIRILLKEFTPSAQSGSHNASPVAFEREVQMARQAAGHPLIPRVEESFSHDRRFYIARQMIAGETLASLIVRHSALPPRTLRKLAACLCDLLCFLHARRIAARAFAPSRINVSPDGYPFLIDLGATQFFPPPSAPGGLENPADELVRADLFALGCTLYEAATGVPPDPEKIRATDVAGDLGSRPNADRPLAHWVARALGIFPSDGPLTAADLQKDLRTFAQPVLLADAHRLTFLAEDVVPQTVRLFNVGGEELRPEVRSRIAWLRASPPVHQGEATEVTVHVVPARAQGNVSWMHGRLEIVNTGPEAGGSGAPQGDRWTIDCSIQAPPRHTGPNGLAPALPADPVAPASTAGRFRPAKNPPSSNFQDSTVKTVSNGETDIVPKTTVIRLICGIIFLALVIGYFAVNRLASHPSGPQAPTPGQGIPLATAHPGGAESGGIAPVATTAPQNLLHSAPGPANWILEQVRPAQATMTTDGAALVVTVVHADGKHWHVQFHPKPVGLVEGRPYLLSFRAKADRPCDLPIEASINQGDYHPIGLQTHASLTKQWQSFSYPFTTVHVLPQNNRLPIFMVGQKPCRIWVSNVTLTPAFH